MQRHTVIKCGHGPVRMKGKSVLASVSRIFRRGGFLEWVHYLTNRQKFGKVANEGMCVPSAHFLGCRRVPWFNCPTKLMC